MTGYPAEAAKVTVYHHHHKVKQQRNNKPNRCYSLANVAPTLHNSMDDKSRRIKQNKQVCHCCRQTDDLCCSELKCC
uniref:Uncharacterized protein n=1 Tax=Glossina palpalis gambiensis TaxID=67801 RepID=A0A1B0C3R3_9MUSC